ncbi:hypothetical protein Cob_v004136 [Colletotrichum orbiculare MAFF 240422]|uniref:Uncharacterized protein n=1 Tax=Colletotrichum orbiculare (strain 104-T / ATCC 96160 / CBS 514.97 / LARS 414 / MAFF 240422) TaxID=1213857 RepID=A0A484FZM6_COLOR|nr:hypothetical protein Cob_v004136 [Colletotrichum orbiculare MAFF 240422]
MGLANHGQGWWAREPQDERKRFDANSNATPTAVLFGNGTIASVEWRWGGSVRNTMTDRRECLKTTTQQRS